MFSGKAHARAVPENLLKLCTDGLWTRQHVRGEEPNGDVAASERRRVATAVAHLRIPAGVKLAAVAFDDEPPVNDEVDAPDTVDDHLQLRSVAKCAENQPDQRFHPRLAARIQEATKHTESPGEPPEHLVQTVLVDKTEMPRTVERRDRMPCGLTHDRLRERFCEVCNERIGGCSRPAPMTADRGRARRQACRVGIDLDVRARPRVHEDPEV